MGYTPYISNNFPRLNGLFPHFGELVERFLIEARKRGMLVDCFQGVRSFSVQKKLYEESLALIKQGKPPKTKAPPGYSFHQYGLACDIVFDQDPYTPGNQWSWDDKRFDYIGLGHLGKSFGLEWAGDWKGGFKEYCHFQKSYGYTITQLKHEYDSIVLSSKDLSDTQIMIEIWNRLLIDVS